MTENLLRHETSPYLLQHKDNPVHWRPWGSAALAQAVRTDTPILLSIGYAACHWCHVMAHESFEDPAVAAVMNAEFVNVKVDREERPDVDTIYMRALHMLGQRGGWPLTMFLAPDGAPFWGGTYFPKAPAHGRPGFAQVLRAVAQHYREQPAAVRRAGGALREALDAWSTRARSAQLPPELPQRTAENMLAVMDPVAGGVRGAPKFPQTQLLGLLWRAGALAHTPDLRNAVRVSLDAMCAGGLHDHIGGGFARYCVDAGWRVPHFEKMLYDNALLMELLTMAFRADGAGHYRDGVAGVAAWMLRRMRLPGGGFAASLDADSGGREGGFYLWTAAEIDEVLGPDASAFKRAYTVTAEGNFEGTNILARPFPPEPAAAPGAAEALLADARARLFARRQQRPAPGCDDKVLADWNGLAISALAQASLVFAQPAWLEAAQEAFGFVTRAMVCGGRLRHSWRAGQARHLATAEDYANMLSAALALLEATGAPAYLEQAQVWLEVFDRHHGADGGWFYTADDADALITRTRDGEDGATPPANATMVQVLLRLAAATGRADYRARALAVLEAFGGAVAAEPASHASFLCARHDAAHQAQVVVTGADEAPQTQALWRAAALAPWPARLLLRVRPGAALPGAHPAAAMIAPDAAPAAFVCRGQVCLPPITDPDQLASALAPALEPSL